MKNASQFLSHSELQNRYDFHVCPLLYCGIISALKNLRKTITGVTTETTKITHKSLSTEICQSKSRYKTAYKAIINEKKEVPLNTMSIAKQNGFMTFFHIRLVLKLTGKTPI